MTKHERWTGKAPPSSDVEARIPKIRERLKNSKSGYLRVHRFSIYDKAAIREMVARGEIETFDSPVGTAYRLVNDPGAQSKD